MVQYYYLNETDPLNGIFHQNQNSIDIDSSAENVNKTRLMNLIDNIPETYSCLQEVDNPYFVFSFKNRKTIIATQYSYLSYNTTAIIKSYPKQWVVSGYYIDEWINISTVIDTNISAPNQIGIFPIDIVLPFSKIRITQIGDPYNTSGQFDGFCAGGFEFFGSFGNIGLNSPTCKQINYNFARFSFVFISIYRSI